MKTLTNPKRHETLWTHPGPYLHLTRSASPTAMLSRRGETPVVHAQALLQQKMTAMTTTGSQVLGKHAAREHRAMRNQLPHLPSWRLLLHFSGLHAPLPALSPLPSLCTPWLRRSGPWAHYSLQLLRARARLAPLAPDVLTSALHRRPAQLSAGYGCRRR
jgi:hypothetical protein